jgi:hypothetical protein
MQRGLGRATTCGSACTPQVAVEEKRVSGFAAELVVAGHVEVLPEALVAHLQVPQPRALRCSRVHCVAAACNALRMLATPCSMLDDVATRRSPSPARRAATAESCALACSRARLHAGRVGHRGLRPLHREKLGLVEQLLQLVQPHARGKRPAAVEGAPRVIMGERAAAARMRKHHAHTYVRAYKPAQ